MADTGFEAASREVGAWLPVDIDAQQIFRGELVSDELARTALLDGIDRGALLVDYMGHGSEASWRGDLLPTADVGSLVNGSRLPFFVNMTCWNGWFSDPYAETLGESLLRAAQGGAIAVWASSGLTEPETQLVMNKELVRLLFGGESLSLGEAVVKAKASVGDMDVRRTWILLGDPVTRLK